MSLSLWRKLIIKPLPVESERNLSDRVSRLLKTPFRNTSARNQLALDLDFKENLDLDVLGIPSKSISGFLDFATTAIPHGDVYLFGGILRDLALYGRKGFNSDIDLVIDGDWTDLLPYLRRLKAQKNKFGGYRFKLGEWPIDIWNAKDTWAIANGIIPYKGISSLIHTTVLNWDAILMNWRTKRFIHEPNYFVDIQERVMDIVLKENPNPLGMVVRVFRHLCLKDARKISSAAARYLSDATKRYSFKEINQSEFSSYKNSIIERKIYHFFSMIDVSNGENIRHQFSIAHDIMEQELAYFDSYNGYNESLNK